MFVVAKEQYKNQLRRTFFGLIIRAKLLPFHRITSQMERKDLKMPQLMVSFPPRPAE
jgi:hypothetical protein